MDIIQIISNELEIKPQQTEAVIALIDEGNTISSDRRRKHDPVHRKVQKGKNGSTKR